MRSPLPFPAAPARRSGFTLVELMVALALAAMIGVAVMVISRQARVVYEETTRKVEVYNKFRFALISLERDFSRWIPTSNLEFFADGKGAGARRNQNWDPGEELPDVVDKVHGPGVVDGGTPKEYDEFASITEHHFTADELDQDGQPVRKVHDAYQVYFRTMTYIEGRTREANVEYMLLDPSHADAYGNPLPPTHVAADKVRGLTLYKIVRYHDFMYDELQKPAQNFPVVRRYVEVCDNITDFRVEYTTGNRFLAKVNEAFRTPREDHDTPAERETRPKLYPDPNSGPDVRKLFGYGSLKMPTSFQKATAFRAIFGDRQGPKGDHRPVRVGFDTNNFIQFAELTPGDKIFIFTEATRAGGGAGGGNQGVAGNAGAAQSFPADNYTVKTNIGGRLEFREDIDSSTWQRDQPGVLYKGAFLPEAVRVTLRVVNEPSSANLQVEARTLQRVIWVRQKAR